MKANQFELVRIKGGHLLFDMINNDITTIPTKGKTLISARLEDQTFDLMRRMARSIFVIEGLKYRILLEVKDEKANS